MKEEKFLRVEQRSDKFNAWTFCECQILYYIHCYCGNPAPWLNYCCFFFKNSLSTHFDFKLMGELSPFYQIRIL